MPILGDILKGLTGPVADYFKVRQETKSKERIRKMELADALHQRRIQLISEGLHADAAWEIEQIKNSGWKDEWVLIILSIPLVGCFLPGVNGYILAGFLTLETTPDWYRWLVMLIFTAIYGIRLWRRQQTDTE
jgi:hypothetical protein